jgi:hypothetical protein
VRAGPWRRRPKFPIGIAMKSIIAYLFEIVTSDARVCFVVGFTILCAIMMVIG